MEDRADRRRRVDAEDREPQTIGPAFHNSREPRRRAGQPADGDEPQEREVEIDDQVVAGRDLLVAFPRQVVDETGLPLAPDGVGFIMGWRQLRRLVRRGGQDASGDPQQFEQPFEERPKIGGGRGRRCQGRREIELGFAAFVPRGATRRQTAGRSDLACFGHGRADCGFEQFRREDRAGAVREIVGLVDDDDGAGQSLVAEVGERDGRIEDVVVVGHDDIRPARQFELHFERANEFRLGLVEDFFRQMLRLLRQQAVQQGAALHLLGVVLCVAAEVFMAKDAVIGAHPFLGPELGHAEPAVAVHRGQRLHRDLLLQVL